MKKSRFALMALAFLFLAGCGGKNDGTITLTGYIQIDPADPQYASWNPTLAAFSELYPNIKLDFEYVTGEQFHDKFQIMATARQIPDLFTLYAGQRSGYILNRGLAMDLRPFLTDEFKANYNEAIWEPQGPNGEIYIIAPNMAVATVIYANPALLSGLGLSPATTLNELIAQVPTIRGAGFDVLMFGNSAVWPGSSLLQSALLERTAGKDWFARAMSGEAKFSDRPFVESLEVIKRMTDARVFSAGMNQLSGLNAITEFVNGRSAYLLQAGWSLSAIRAAADPEFFNTILVLPFPDLPNDLNPGSNVATLGEAIGMSSRLGKEKAEAAWAFLSFLYGEFGMDALMRKGSDVTYRLDLSKYDIDPVMRQYIEMTDRQHMGWIIDAKMDGEGVNLVLNPGIQAITIGSKTPQQVADEYEAWVAANEAGRRR
jgi:raffinose/stachyose/melibiose transport system substrate-binding protein